MPASMQQGMLLQRPVFKMNPSSDFWEDGRGGISSPNNPDKNNFHNIAAHHHNNLNSENNNQPMIGNLQNMNLSNPGSVSSVVESTQEDASVNLPTPSFNNNNQDQEHVTEDTSVERLPLDSPTSTSSNIMAVADPKIMTEKLVSELQNRSGMFSERTLEECWNTLQRIFMHKSMQMQLQQRTGPSSVGSSSFSSGGGGLEISKPHQCQQCLKSFSSNHQLVQHIRVHTGEKPYKCSYCERRFKQLSHVQQHTRLHTGERPYRCHLAECGRAFIQLSNLQQHLRNHDAQVERAKNRPFHCTICGKGFATESSLRTHAAKEAELRMDVLQQHAVMLGNATTTSCPICHKLFIGTEALIEHMKFNHKDPSSPPAPAALPPTNPYIAKRRSANHTCPVCGKHYVNEGSLRKHLACHPETAQLATSLRMWPCSVCQAVFTHESGLLSHMEHMRMDPKHQFAAQYVLSRAAAERRERDSIMAAAALASGTGGLPLGLSGAQPSMCPSPSVQSDSSSNNGEGRLSSNGSDPGSSGVMMHNNNNNNNNNENAAAKLAELMAGRTGAVNNTHPYLNQQTPQFNADDLQRAATALLMSQQQAVAAAAAAAQSVSSSQDHGMNPSVVQVAAANLAAAAIRMTQPSALQHNQQFNNQNPLGTAGSTADSMMQIAMNAAVRASMSSIVNEQQNSHQSILHQQQQNTTSSNLRMQEVFLRSQAEAALRLAVSQAVAASTTTPPNDTLQSVHNMMNNQNGQHLSYHHQSQVAPELTEALRLQEQRLEQALRMHGDARTMGFPFNTQQHHINQ